MSRKEEIQENWWGKLTDEQKDELRRLRRLSRKGWVKVESVKINPGSITALTDERCYRPGL